MGVVRRELTALLARAGCLAAATLLLAAPLGLIWPRLAPHVGVDLTTGDFTEPESTAFFVADLVFAVTTGLVGLATGAVTWAALRDRGVAAPLTAGFAGLLAGRVAAEVGSRVVLDDRVFALCRGGDCPLYDGTHRLRSGPFVLAWAIAALLAVVVLTLWRDHEPDDAEADEVS